MKNYIALSILLFVFHASIAQVQKTETEHFRAKYDSEVEAYATASLKVLEAAWTIASKNGFYLPETIKFTILASERNALYFDRKSLKEITWESWADYFGNMLIDSLYEELGIDFWPEPHDYTQYAGMDFFRSRIEQNNPDLLSFNRACLFWYTLGKEIGFSKIFSFFEAIDSQKVDNPGAKGKFAAVLSDYLDTGAVEDWCLQYADYLILNF
jgi:hypothetical protein